MAQFVFVVVQCQIGVFEGMAGQHVGDAFIGVDKAFGPQVFEARYRRRRRRLTAESVFADNCLCVADFPIRYRAQNTVAYATCAQKFFQIDKPDVFC